MITVALLLFVEGEINKFFLKHFAAEWNTNQPRAGILCLLDSITNLCSDFPIHSSFQINSVSAQLTHSAFPGFCIVGREAFPLTVSLVEVPTEIYPSMSLPPASAALHSSLEHKATLHPNPASFTSLPIRDALCDRPYLSSPQQGRGCHTTAFPPPSNFSSSHDSSLYFSSHHSLLHGIPQLVAILPSTCPPLHSGSNCNSSSISQHLK